MRVSNHLYGGAGLFKKFIIGATFSRAGVICMDPGAGTHTGVIPVTATSFADAGGLAAETATYDATAPDPTGIVTVDIRPDAVIWALLSGGAGDGTALPIMTQTAASTTVLSATNSNDGDMISGILWRYPGRGMEAGDEDWREITSDVASTSVTITLEFPTTMAVGDRFLQAPYNPMPKDGSTADDANGHVNTTTNLDQANTEIVAGTGGAAHIIHLGMRDELSSYVEFTLADHIHQVVTT